MKVGKANFKWFSEGGVRLDSSYHLSEGRVYRKTLEKSPLGNKTIGEVSSDIFYGGRAKRVYVDNEKVGIPFMGSADMLRSDFSSLKYISKKLTKNLDAFLLNKEWTLISRSGTIGNTAYVTEDFDGKAASEHIIRVVPNEKIQSGYLYSFLSSKYGYMLMTQGTFGAVIQHVEPDYLSGLPIPILPESKQEEIHNLIVESSNLRVEANKLLKEATNYFEEDYKVEGFTNVFSKKVTDLGFSWASYNNNLECDKIENSYQDQMTIGDVATKCFAPPLFKHIYLSKDNGHPFLTGAELTKFIKKYYRWLSPRGVKNINDYKVEKGTLLLYKSGTTDGGILGNVFIADDILHGTCLSDHVIRITTDDLRISYWIYAFLKSSSGVKLLQKMATGSMIPFITPDRLLQVKVPKPNDKLDWVFEKIEGYIEKSSGSHRKELKAIDIVEKEIESWQK